MVGSTKRHCRKTINTCGKKKKFKKNCTKKRKGWIVCRVLRFYGCIGVDHGGSPIRTRNVFIITAPEQHNHHPWLSQLVLSRKQSGQNQQQKKTNRRTHRMVGEKSPNLEASVTPHPTAYQRMGALKRHRVASREPRFEKETGTRREEAAAGHWDSAPPNQITTTITHANHHHDHPRKNKQRARDEKRNGKTQERNQALQPLEEDKR